MAYETGSSTGPSDLLDKLRLFLIDESWTVNSWADDTHNYSSASGIDGTGKRLHVQKTATDGTVMYFNFRSAIRGAVCSDFYSGNTITSPTRYYGELTGIAINGSTGYGVCTLNISSMSSGGTGKTTVVCSRYHNYQTGDSVTIAGTSGGYYDGTYTIESANANSFTITKTFTSTSTGTVVNSTNRLWSEQAGISLGGGTYGDSSWAMFIAELSTTAIPAYYFFSDGDTISVVVEYETGKYQFMCFGCLEKQGVYTGGQFFAGSYRSYDACHAFYRKSSTYSSPLFLTRYNSGQASYHHGAVYLNVDSSAAWRCENSDSNLLFPAAHSEGDSDSSSRRMGFGYFFHKRGPNSYNSMAAMCPAYIFAKRSNGNYSLLGWPKSVRLLNIGVYTGGQELTYGSETWKVFPADTDGDNLEKIGWAFKKVT